MKRPINALVVLLTLSAMGSHAKDWNQWLGNERDGVWKENGVVKSFPDDGPKLLWKTPIGPGYSGPSVSGGRVYVMDRQVRDSLKAPEKRVPAW